MKASLVPASDPAWSRVLADARHDFYHLPAFAELEAERIGGTAVALVVDDDEGRLLLPLVMRPVGGSRVDATSPYGYPGPIVTGAGDPAFVESAFREAIPMLHDAGFVSLFLRFHPILNSAPPSSVGVPVLQGDTIAVDLSASDEQHWQETRRDHRSNIERSIMSGYSVRFEDRPKHLGVFKDLYRATMRRVGASSEYFFDDHYFGGLVEALGERLHLAVMEADKTIAAAVMLVETDGIVEYHLMGVHEAFVSEGPAKLILHVARGWAKERGDRYFHLGGGVGGANDSLLRFKAGFSPLRFPFYTFRVIVDPKEYRRLAHEHAPASDPSDSRGFFPVYRQVPSHQQR